MPAAKLSLEIASRIDDASSSLNARVEAEQPVVKAVKSVARRRAGAKRVRRAA
jgi:hypothetical protein